MPLRQTATAAINAIIRRRIRRRARARYERRRAPGISPRTTALIVASALFMEQLDGTVLATALPEMARSFGTEAVRLNVALTSYLLALAVFIPASGKVADRFGSRTVFCGAIALFTLGSILCGQANGLGTLVAARVLQGIGGAMMVPVGRLFLLRSVTKAEMVTAMTWLMIPAQLGPLLGPPVGGFLVTYLSWRWIFYINVPIGVLGILLALRFIADVREPGRVNFDLPGLVLSGISLACLVAGLEAVSRGGASLVLAGEVLAAGVVAGALYVLHARRHPAPVLDLKLMRVPTFALSVIGGGLSRVAAGAVPFLLPLMLQLGFGMSAAASGLITFGGSLGSMLMRFVARPVLHRWGFRTTMIWNGLIASGFLGTYAFMRPVLAAGGHPGAAGGGRVLPVAAVHRLQHHRLCRYSAGPHERGDQLLHDIPAAQPDAGHLRGGGGTGRVGAGNGARTAGDRGLQRGVPGGGRGVAAGIADLHPVGGGCGR